MGAQEFQSNFVPKLPQNGRFSALNFVFLKDSFPTRKFSERLKFRGMLPTPCHDATDRIYDYD